MHDHLQLLKDIVHKTPLPIAVYKGLELKIELANLAMIEAWDKGKDVIGKNYLEVLPEFQKQQIHDEALHTFKTGTAFHGKDIQVDFND